MTLERLVVVGAGAVGGSIGGLLWESGLPIALVARGAHAAALRRDGLDLRLADRSVRVRATCVERAADVEWRAGDVVLLATKLQDAAAALDDVRAAGGARVPIVCATNGVHAERWAAERFETVLSMLVWLPATHLEPGEIRLHSRDCMGVLDTGPAGPWAEELCARLRSAGFDAVVRDDIARWKRAKWITNLGGAAQALMADGWERAAEAARAEGEATLDAAGLDRVPTGELLERVKHVGLAPVDDRRREGGSTWQSYRRGVPLESRWIEGAMAELAAEVGVRAPVNAFFGDVAAAPRAVSEDEIPFG